MEEARQVLAVADSTDTDERRTAGTGCTCTRRLPPLSTWDTRARLVRFGKAPPAHLAAGY